jgi:predicted DNA-binding transcriptional regulator YafY
MILKGGLIYIVVWREDKDKPFTLSMHRISKAEIEYLDAKMPPGWGGLDAHNEGGNFLFPPGSVEKNCLVTLRFDSISTQNLREMPLSADQIINEEATRGSDGNLHYLVRARVTVSEEFVRWLLQYGDHVEVIKPASLRKRMKTIVASLHSRYKTD